MSQLCKRYILWEGRLVSVRLLLLLVLRLMI